MGSFLPPPLMHRVAWGLWDGYSFHRSHFFIYLYLFCLHSVLFIIWSSDFISLKIELMPHDLITQLLRVLAIETRQEKALISADPTELALSGLEAFSFDYIVKWPLSLIINR